MKRVLFPTLVIATFLAACGPDTALLHDRPALDLERVEDTTVDEARLAAASSPNSLGAWLWYLEGTGFSSHSQLATELARVGIHRVYVKVADGAVDASRWPEVDDARVPAAYRARGIEVFAWAYNYPGSSAAQAAALERAAAAGYQGFVTDVEVEFDGKTTELRELMSAFSSARARVLAGGAATFPFYATSWGNPADHSFHVEIVDAFVDAHLPQTYVETWGGRWLTDVRQAVRDGTAEYRRLGARKPVFHVVSNERRGITTTQLNAFLAEAALPGVSGTAAIEASVWRIPSKGSAIWNDLAAINWNLGAPTGALTMQGPATAQVGAPFLLQGTASRVARVEVTIDGYPVGSAVVRAGAWSLQVTVTQPGATRAVLATGLGTDGQAVATARRTLQVTPATAAARLTITSPLVATVGQRVTLQGTASGVTSLRATVDGFELEGNGGGRVDVRNGVWAFPVTFQQAGAQRALRLEGRDASGATVARLSATLEVRSGFAQVPYFFQYANTVNPGGSCQNTSIAMILRGRGAPDTETPDAISRYWGTSAAQTVSGFNDVFNREAQFLGLAVRAVSTEAGTVTQVRAELALGRPVVVHGYFTSYGHVMVLVGYDAQANQYIANDPAGRWSQRYGVGGYSQQNATEGRAVRYGAAAVDGAIAPDGKVWFHRFTP
jgi:hypothetical protein